MKKIFFYGLAIIFVLSPVFVSAQSSDDAEIQALLIQIQGLIAIVEDLQSKLALFGGVSQDSFTFTRDLSLGQSGVDVLMLQRTLNESGAHVADSGPGSPGNETDYFGSKTKAAVKRFQNNHAFEILLPQNLVEGNGIVGQRTREALNAILRNDTGQGISAKDPVITSISPETGKNGSTITVFGENFDRNSNRVLTSFGIFDVPSIDGKTLMFSLYSGTFAEINISDEDLEIEFGGDDSTEDVPQPDDAEAGLVPTAFPVPISISNTGGTSQPILFYMQP